MGARLEEADVMSRVDDVDWNTELDEIEALLLIVGTRIEKKDPPPPGYRDWKDVLVQIARNWNTR